MLNALKKSFTSKIIKAVFTERPELGLIKNRSVNSKLGKHTKVYSLYNIENTNIDDYTYVSTNSKMINTSIGKFCSVGPNLVSGWGIHPTHTLSTSPMFYSTLKQNGMSLSAADKFDETSRITIGNDVFIGMNVTILDGVIIGDGAVIGAGAVVSKNIPPYAIAVGSPIKVIKYRFDEETIKALLQIKWWNWPEEQLKIVEKELSNVAQFVEKYKVSQ